MGNDKKEYIQWHPLFVKSIKAALKASQIDQVQVFPEVALSSKPLVIDVVVVNDASSDKLDHPIFELFRRFNIIEFKSPQDYLTLKDFDKGVVYSRLHYIVGELEEDVLHQYTISYFCSHYPRVMMEFIKYRGLVIEENNPITGIYQIKGEMYPMQVVVFNEIEEEKYLWPFCPYLDDKTRVEHRSFINLFREFSKNPSDQDIRCLFDFSVKHHLFTLNEWKEVWSMAIQELTEEELKEYFDVMKDTVIASKWRQESYDEGYDEGRDKGRDEGRDKGLDEGRNEGVENSIVAINKIKEGVSENEIHQLTGLSLEVIQELKRSVQ